MTPTGPRIPATGSSRNVNLERRAEIGAERRARSRNAILAAACRLYGTPEGQATRIEDILREARIARGTFYNHFSDLHELRHRLLDDLTREFDRAVHMTFPQLEGPVEQIAVAIRYYLHAAAQNPEWGWAMVNSGVPGHLFGKTVWTNAYDKLHEAILAGHCRLRDAVTGRDIVLGTLAAATASILRGGMPVSYPEEIAAHILLACGVGGDAWEIARRPLPPLPLIAHELMVIINMQALSAAISAAVRASEPPVMPG